MVHFCIETEKICHDFQQPTFDRNTFSPNSHNFFSTCQSGFFTFFLSYQRVYVLIRESQREGCPYTVWGCHTIIHSLPVLHPGRIWGHTCTYTSVLPLGLGLETWSAMWHPVPLTSSLQGQPRIILFLNFLP